MVSRKLIFYLDYDKFGRDEAPAILPFLQVLREGGNEVEFAGSEAELLEGVKKGCHAVAVSVFSTLELRDSLRAVVRVKKADPGIPILLGGKGVTGYGGILINALGVDVVAEGEGEMVLPPLLENMKGLKKDGLLEAFKRDEIALDEGEKEYFRDSLELLLGEGVMYRSPIPREAGEKMVNAGFTREVGVEGGTISIHVPVAKVFVKTYEGEILRAEPDYGEVYAEEKKKFDGEYPLSYRAFLKHARPHPTEEEINKTASYPWDIAADKGWRAVSIYAQRGCNWGLCSYCGISTPRGRCMDPTNVVSLLEGARERGITQATFEDDQFLQNPRWVRELCSLIAGHGLNRDMQFGAMVRVDSIRGKEQLDMLRKANFVKLQVGVESLLPEKVRYFRKTPRGREAEYVAKAVELIENCLELGIQPGVFIIASRPKKRGALVEVAEELRAVTRVMTRAYDEFSLLPTISFNDMLMAYPGAPLLESEDYKRIILPLGPVRTGRGIVLTTMEIPYIFEFKSIDLANLIGNLLAIGRKRGAPPEVVNETLEHIEDLVQALQISAQQLLSEVGLALRILEDTGGSQKDVKRVLGGKTRPEDVFRGVNLAAYRKAAEEEKRRILDACREVMMNLKAVKEPMVMEVNSHLREVKERLRSLEMDKKKLPAAIEDIRRETEALLIDKYSCLQARNSLESLLAFMDEFEKAMV